LSLSAVLYGNSHQGRLTFGEVAATTDLVFAEDGVNDSIAVVRTDANVSLRINGKVDASTGDARTQLLLGHFGSRVSHYARRVLIVGFGGGMTASAVARYPDVEEIDCVEIEPAVIRAAPYLEDLNRGVLSDPRVHVIFDDARNFLLTSREKYDLIILSPPILGSQESPRCSRMSITPPLVSGSRQAEYLSSGCSHTHWNRQISA